MMNTRVLFVYRKRAPHFFSIEKVFMSLQERIGRKIPVEEIAAPCHTSSLGEIIKNLLVLRKGKADVYHITGDIHYAAIVFPGSRTVLTIHDCGFMNNYSGMKKRLLKWLFLDMPVRRCKVVTTISERTKADILRYTGCSPEKVLVIPNPVNEQIHATVKTFNEACPDLLFIGSTPNKNLPRVIEALKGIHCRLTIVGKIAPERMDQLKQAGIDYQQLTGLSEEALIRQYEKTDLLIFPSTFEGFGVPIIEAQKAGRLVITSAVSPMKEVAGKGAYLVDPENVDEIRSAVQKLTENNILRESLIEAGLQNVKRFDLDAIAQQYRNMYDKYFA